MSKQRTNVIEKQETSAIYDATTGILKKTLLNEKSAAILFGNIGVEKQGSKGTYLDFSRLENGSQFIMIVNDGEIEVGILTINEYEANVIGEYNVTFSIGKSSITKDIKHNDLASMSCVVKTACAVLAMERERVKEASKAAA